jgi:hypothetical protein
MEFVLFKEGMPVCSVAFSPWCDDVRVAAIYKPEKEPSPEIDCVGTLILDFKPLELWENALLLFNLLLLSSLWCAVMPVWAVYALLPLHSFLAGHLSRLSPTPYSLFRLSSYFVLLLVSILWKYVKHFIVYFFSLCPYRNESCVRARTPSHSVLSLVYLKQCQPYGWLSINIYWMVERTQVKNDKLRPNVNNRGE